MAVIPNFDTATLEGLVTALTKKHSVATAPSPNLASEPDGARREAARVELQAAMNALTTYIASIV